MRTAEARLGAVTNNMCTSQNVRVMWKACLMVTELLKDKNRRLTFHVAMVTQYWFPVARSFSACQQ